MEEFASTVSVYTAGKCYNNASYNDCTSVCGVSFSCSSGSAYVSDVVSYCVLAWSVSVWSYVFYNESVASAGAAIDN